MELKPICTFYVGFVFILLIVPYGIETGYSGLYYRRGISLLIVPYGIETLKEVMLMAWTFAFNRTLWN